MSTTIRLKNSSALVGGKAKVPTPSDLAQGELAVNTNKDDPSLFVKDSDGVVRKIAGSDAAGVAGEYLSLASGEIDQTVRSTGTTEFRGDVEVTNGTIKSKNTLVLSADYNENAGAPSSTIQFYADNALAATVAPNNGGNLRIEGTPTIGTDVITKGYFEDVATNNPGYLRTDVGAGEQTILSTDPVNFRGGLNVTGGAQESISQGFSTNGLTNQFFGNVNNKSVIAVRNTGVTVLSTGIDRYQNNHFAPMRVGGTCTSSGTGRFSFFDTSTSLDGDFGTSIICAYTANHNTTTEDSQVGGFAGFRAMSSFASGIRPANLEANYPDTYKDYIGAGFLSEIGSWEDKTFNFLATGIAPNYFAGNLFIGGDIGRNTYQLWKSTLTEEQKEQLEAGTLAIPANVSTPGDGSFARQWWYDQQSAEDQALIDSGELDYPSHLQAETFDDDIALGDNTNIKLRRNGLGEFKNIAVEDTLDTDTLNTQKTTIRGRDSSLIVGGINYGMQAVGGSTAAFLPIKTISGVGTGATFKSVNTDGNASGGASNCPRLLFQRCQTTDSEILVNEAGNAIRDNWTPAPDGALLGELAFGTGGATVESEEYYVRFSPYKRVEGGELQLGLYKNAPNPDDPGTVEYFYFRTNSELSTNRWRIDQPSDTRTRFQSFNNELLFSSAESSYAYNLIGLGNPLKLGAIETEEVDGNVTTTKYGMFSAVSHAAGQFGIFTNDRTIDIANNSGYLRLVANGNVAMSGGTLSVNGNSIVSNSGTWGFGGYYGSNLRIMNAEDWSGIDFGGSTPVGGFGIRSGGNRTVDIANTQGRLRLLADGNIETSGTVNGAIASSSITLQTEAANPASFQTTTETYDDGTEYESTTYVGETLDLIQVIQDLRARVAELEGSSASGSDFESRVAALETDMARFKAI